MFTILMVCLIIMVAVLGLTIATINKGYAYEHKVDPLPQESPVDYNETDHDDKKAE
ncbi:YtzI protein [Pontibacillus sp. HMF3514]|uniref:YtzI protein n=1 Tax=Pontibacillus sp. HMF3514 TaxID=2692425 RepID=UPI001320410E|nr:YtzI protein [Pontibacillus sp. HMF3514]QHE51843.1 YtzI protein [Pontibacillus sp. HMF3514]